MNYNPRHQGIQKTYRFETVQDRHREIHHNHVGLQGICLVDSFSAILRLSAYIEVGLTFERFTQGLPNWRIVVYHKDSPH